MGNGRYNGGAFKKGNRGRERVLKGKLDLRKKVRAIDS